MDEEKQLKTKRLKIYLAPLLRINPSLIRNLDREVIDIQNSQVFIYKKDVFREIFSYILLEKGKVLKRKPTFRLVTLDDLVSQHFTNNFLTPLCFPDILFIVHGTGYTGNPIYYSVFSKVLEERKLNNKPTYLYFKGTGDKAAQFGINKDLHNFVNYNVDDPTQLRAVEKVEIDDSSSSDTKRALEAKRVKKSNNVLKSWEEI